MGNLSYLVPTKNIEKFNIKHVSTLLEQNFLDLKLDIYLDSKEIQIRNKKEVMVTTLYFEDSCKYLFDYERDIETINDPENRIQNGKELILKLNVLRGFNPDLDNCIALTYGEGIFIDDKFRIERFLMKEFNGYLFDEGIHPEFQTFEEID